MWNEIMTWILGLDESLLLFINGMHNPFFDSIMWTVSEKWVWIPFYLLLAYLIFRRGTWRNGTICLLMIALLITMTDQTCASLIRPTAERLRPSNPDNPVSGLIHLVNGYHGGRYGFPSCHAANSFALSVFLSLYFKRKAITTLMLAWAVLVSYSRVYLGVHYPGDILAGMAVGTSYAILLYLAFSYYGYLGHARLVIRQFIYSMQKMRRSPVFSKYLRYSR